MALNFRRVVGWQVSSRKSDFLHDPRHLKAANR